MTPEPTPELDLDAIEVRSALATAGPWHTPHEDGYGCVYIGNYGWVAGDSRGNGPSYDVDDEQGHADAEFIAHAREDVPALVAEVRRLRAVSSPPVEDTADVAAIAKAMWTRLARSSASGQHFTADPAKWEDAVRAALRVHGTTAPVEDTAAAEIDCPQAKRPCGHHCNCSWEQDVCHWCGKEFLGEDA